MGLSAGSYRLFIKLGAYFQGTARVGFPNLSLGDCWGFILFFTVSKTSFRLLSARGYRLFIRLRTYFQESNSGLQSVYKLSF